MRPWRVPYAKFGAGPGLDRVRAVARRLTIDLAAFGATGAVIVGSNGKGSTAAMAAAVLTEAGVSVGLFTSPHLFDLNERFRIDGDDISDEELQAHWARVVEAVEAEGLTDTLGGFEFLFMIAADWFSSRGCGATVWEAGIGGRLDPVRLIEAKRCALTALDLEHTELLGDTLADIAREKIDAAPGGATLFVSDGCLQVRDAIDAHCAQRDVTPVWIAPASQAPLPGKHQRSNAALACALAGDIVDLPAEAIDAGFARVRWPGRLERLGAEPLTVIDVGHTPDAIRRALSAFSDLRGVRDTVLVCGASSDKDARAVISALAPAFSTIVCARASHKGAPAAEIAAYANAANPEAELILADSVAEARRLAEHRAGNGGAIYVAGGLFLAAEYKAVHQGRDPATLAFF